MNCLKEMISFVLLLLLLKPSCVLLKHLHRDAFQLPHKETCCIFTFIQTTTVVVCYLTGMAWQECWCETVFFFFLDVFFKDSKGSARVRACLRVCHIENNNLSCNFGQHSALCRFCINSWIKAKKVVQINCIALLPPPPSLWLLPVVYTIVYRKW